MNKIMINNEKKLTEWFIKNYANLGFNKIIKQNKNRFPDFIMEKDGSNIKVELETLLSHFILHKHNIDNVDLIICVIKDVDIKKEVIDLSEFIIFNKKTTTIQVEDNTWQELNKRKDVGETFDEVINRILKKEDKKKCN